MTTAIGPAPLRLGELAGILALGQDLAFGQPPESQLRAAVLAVRIGEQLGVTAVERDTVYWCGSLRYLGCTGHAHEVARLFGDDIATRDRTLRYDAGKPADVLRDVLTHAAPDRRGLARVPVVVDLLANGRRGAALNFRTGCEVGDELAARLGMPDPVRAALAFTFERWNGKGQPTGAKRERIPLPMRIVHLACDVQVLARTHSTEAALGAVGDRSGGAYDPAVAAAALPVVADLLDWLSGVEPWDEALRMEPGPGTRLIGAELDAGLEVLADFADLKSPFTGGHSRGVAHLATGAAELAGLDAAAVQRLRNAALVHDIGRTGIPNSVWDKAGPLSRAERDRAELHPLLTEQLVRRGPALAGIAALAGSHHERPNGTGYVKGLSGAGFSLSARLLAAADRYHALCEPRAYRAAHSRGAAAELLRAMVATGAVDAAAADHVLVADGHRVAARRSSRPAGLTAREIEVLALLARGLTTRQIADHLVISAKTADTHIQHIYTKIGCSTRGAAALFAMQHQLLG